MAALQPRHGALGFLAHASHGQASLRSGSACGGEVYLPLVDRLCPDRDDWLELVQHLEIMEAAVLVRPTNPTPPTTTNERPQGTPLS